MFARPRPVLALAGAGLALALWSGAGWGQGPTLLYTVSEAHPTFSVFHDPDGDVSVKEFAFFRNVVTHLDTLGTPDSMVVVVQPRDLYHLIYQRSGGRHAAETTFGHAWSRDLVSWTVDTLAFAVDTTWWNRRHVWSPSLIEANGRTYMFYTGVDDQNDQRIGYTSTAVLDTTNTVWGPARVMVWEAANTGWAVPDPPVYGGETQFRDAYLMNDPDHPGSLLMYYDAHDSADAKLNRGALAVGIARSDSGSVDSWHDLGYFPNTLRSVTGIPQLEGPHVFSVNGTGENWRLMFSNGGSPPGEHGGTTIRFETLAPGESPSDTTASHWSTPIILSQYLGVPTAFGWSGSEEMHVSGADLLGGFTAWSLGSTGIAFTRILWNGTDFTLAAPSVTAVDEVRSPTRGVTLRLAAAGSRAREVTFLIETPVDLAAKLEVFDLQGRRTATPFEGVLAHGRATVPWPLRTGDGEPLANGVYFARLSYAGGQRTLQLAVAR